MFSFAEKKMKNIKIYFSHLKWRKNKIMKRKNKLQYNEDNQKANKNILLLLTNKHFFNNTIIIQFNIHSRTVLFKLIEKFKNIHRQKIFIKKRRTFKMNNKQCCRFHFDRSILLLFQYEYFVRQQFTPFSGYS